MFNLSNQEKITIIFLLVVIIIGLGIILYKNINFEKNITINPPINPSENNSTVKIEIPPIIVHIAGAVRSPGVYQLKSTDRIIDAVKIAGGPTEQAYLNAINLAALLKDGQKIIVPYKITDSSDGADNENIYKKVENINSFSTADKININTANASTLRTLPGIGPVLSERIIEYRNQNGLFGIIDDIKDVSGIGEKKFEGIKDLICVQ